jgi:hypothetical protein
LTARRHAAGWPHDAKRTAGAKSRRNAKTDGYDGDSGADQELSDSTPFIVIGRKGFFLTVKM